MINYPDHSHIMMVNRFVTSQNTCQPWRSRCHVLV